MSQAHLDKFFEYENNIGKSYNIKSSNDKAGPNYNSKFVKIDNEF